MVQANGNTESAKLANIPLNRIRENEVALRHVDKEKEEYSNLVDSVRKNGILNPIVVREFQDPKNPEEILYGLIDGLQRFNAAIDAGLKEIPANIKDMGQSEVEEAQIIANCQKIETRPIEYAHQMSRLLERKPTMGVHELAARLSKSPDWIYKQFNLVKRLNPELHQLLDESKFSLSNAYELSKLPQEEQLDWLERAMTMSPGDFATASSARQKQIKEARRQGRLAAPSEFTPQPHLRKSKEVIAEYQQHTKRDEFLKRFQLKTPQEAWDLAIAWILNVDPDGKAQQIAEHEAWQKKNKEEKEKARLERLKQREDEAKKTKEALESRLSAAGAQT